MENNPDCRLYQIGLTMVNGIGDILGRQLLQAVGDAEAVFTEKAANLERIHGIGRTLIAEIKRPEVLQKAEKELAFVDKNAIRTYFLSDPHYPARLRECADAPLLCYFKGEGRLDAKHVLSIVGTRRITQYGMDLTAKFVAALAKVVPDVLIVSGLAYGVDVQAHRQALKQQLPTIGVLAHGLDRIYPPSHRQTAVEMLAKGGLLTEFPSGSNPDKPNFVRRNRIIAGLSDATLVVESADRGGSLITAGIAFSYGRDVFAFPGRVDDWHSQGCNRIIRQNEAALITSADDFIAAMNWDLPQKAPLPIQKELPFFEDEDSRRVVEILQAKQEVHLNQLAVETHLPVYKLASLMLELEMEGYVNAIPGNMYRLCKG